MPAAYLAISAGIDVAGAGPNVPGSRLRPIS